MNYPCVLHLLFNLNYLIYLILNLYLILKCIQLIRIHISICNVAYNLYSNRMQRIKYIAHIANEINVTGLFSQFNRIFNI